MNQKRICLFLHNYYTPLLPFHDNYTSFLSSIFPPLHATLTSNGVSSRHYPSKPFITTTTMTVHKTSPPPPPPPSSSSSSSSPPSSSSSSSSPASLSSSSFPFEDSDGVASFQLFTYDPINKDATSPSSFGYDPHGAKLFLIHYWQKRPLLFRKALHQWTPPLNPQDLAGWALRGPHQLQHDIESRLVYGPTSALDPLQRQHLEKLLENHPDPGLRKKILEKEWAVRHGPFTETDFNLMPDVCCSLLVQSVDKFIPQVAQLFDLVSFLPSWRFDDVMVSYACPGGGVGPHLDNYDVFLLQGKGHRNWKISYDAISPGKQNLIQNSDLSVLNNGFEPDRSWVLEPGDILYVPPRVPHWGTAVDDECMTYSIGFRSPSINDTLISYSENLGSRYREHRLQDHRESLAQNISPLNAPTVAFVSDSVVDHARQSLIDIVSKDEQDFADWYCKFVTFPKRVQTSSGKKISGAEAKQLIDRVLRLQAQNYEHHDQNAPQPGHHAHLLLTNNAMIAYRKVHAQDQNGQQHEQYRFYINGSKLNVEDDLAFSTTLRWLADNRRVSTEELSQFSQQQRYKLTNLLAKLLARGYITVLE